MELPVDLVSPVVAAGGKVDEQADYTAWDEAYRRVEAYFSALRIRNKLLLSTLVHRVLQRAAERQQEGEVGEPIELAMDQANREVTQWFVEILGLDEADRTDPALRGRLALLLADMPRQWQHEFLTDPPWPEPFMQAMRQSFLQAGPDFHLSQMEARPLELGPIPTFTGQALRDLDARPHLRNILMLLVVIGAAFLIFYLTR
ncbi:MAG: hypothetical protein Q7P63_11175 [Verrucomicrobiota bacterium JB022]|nr:hypothetical protein [Verrucomicrobiota bacterium JB022]